MKAVDRFLNYVATCTTSDETSTTVPSTAGQFEFAQQLSAEMRQIGITEVEVSEKGYVYGTIPATKGMEQEPAIGFISHMDTAPAMSGKNVNPQIIENYNGKDILINKEKNILMKTEEFPHLLNYTGQDLIVTDGTTLLGADDKAGIAEILTMAEELLHQVELSHGKIRLGFTPDEEIGRGADCFDVTGFGAEYAYTVDGGELGELEYENFNAASAVIIIHGVNIHPGEAKNKMKHALLIGMELEQMLPAFEKPANTEGYEGFYHLCSMEGREEQAKLEYIIRDHDLGKFRKRKEIMEAACQYINLKYGEGTAEIELKDSYYNMKSQLEPHMEIVERAKKAMEKGGIRPKISPIRGGTDGARLSYMGLPCPNLSTGGHDFHGKFEYIPVQSMEKMVEILINIACKQE